MIKEVIDNIKAAEQEAGSILDEGRKNARATSTAAAAEAQRQAEGILNDARENAARGLRHAEQEAGQKAQQRISSGDEEIAAQKQAARGRLDQAVNVILGRLA